MREFELKYWSERKNRIFVLHFKTFKEAYDHATKLGLVEFQIDGVDYYNI